MSKKLGEYLAEYILGEGRFQKYFIAAFDDKDQCIGYLESSEGMIVSSSDLKNCELLRDAQLLHEDIIVSRNSRNTCEIYCLTELGGKMAQKIIEESLVSKEQEKSP